MRSTKVLFKRVRPLLFLIIGSTMLLIMLILFAVQYFQFKKTVLNEIDNTLNYAYHFMKTELTFLSENGLIHDESTQKHVSDATYNMGVFCAYEYDGTVIFDDIHLSSASAKLDQRYSRSLTLNDAYGHRISFTVSVKSASGMLHLRFDRMFSEYQKNVISNLSLFIPIVVILSYLLAYFFSSPVVHIKKWLDETVEKCEKIAPVFNGIGEFRDIQKSLNDLVQKILDNENWRKSLLEDLGHEIRTPLCIINMQLEALADGVFKPSPEIFRNLYREVTRLTAFFDDIQVLQAAEASRFDLNYQVTDIRSIVDEVFDLFFISCRNKNIQLKKIAEYVPLYAYCDRNKVKQALINLVSNALKYTGENGTIIISCGATKDYLNIRVTDNGIGIEESELENIFKRFYRVKSDAYQSTSGSGIGLSIAKSYIEAHGGNILVQSKPGHGSTFIIQLPTRNYKMLMDKKSTQ